MDGYVKIHFRLTQDDDDYPPVAVESVWALLTQSYGEYVIDNAPFFAREATVGDVVKASESEGGLWYEQTVKRSDHSLIRVICFDRNAVQEIRENLRTLGAYTEYLEEYNLIAVSISEYANFLAVQSFLRTEAALSRLDYEEAIIRSPRPISHNEE